MRSLIRSASNLHLPSACSTPTLPLLSMSMSLPSLLNGPSFMLPAVNRIGSSLHNNNNVTRHLSSIKHRTKKMTEPVQAAATVAADSKIESKGVTTRAVRVPRVGTSPSHSLCNHHDWEFLNVLLLLWSYDHHFMVYVSGGLEVLEIGNVDLAAPKPNEILVQV
jgi:hypothetical protein